MRTRALLVLAASCCTVLAGAGLASASFATGIAADQIDADTSNFTSRSFDFIAVCPGPTFFEGVVGGPCAGPGLGDAYVFLVSEAGQGHVDLNGDGDTDDKVVFATRLTDRDRNGRFDFAEVSAP